MSAAAQTIQPRVDFRRGDRLIIKTFKDADTMHRFLNSQYDNRWTERHASHADKKAGTYAFAGGQWHNVSKLDASALAHI